MSNGGIVQLRKAVEFIRDEVDIDFAPSQWLIVLLAHEKPGITMPEMRKYLDMPQGSLSRNIKRLTKYFVTLEDGSRELRGYDLIRLEPDVEERRRYAVYLSKRGEEFVSKLQAILEGGD